MGIWAPRPPRRKETIGKMGGGGKNSAQIFPQSSPPQGRLRAFKPALRFCQNPWGELWGKSCLKTRQFPYGLGGRLLPMDFGNFGPKGTPWGRFIQMKFGNLVIGKMGVFNQDFTPELSPKTLGKKGNFCFFPNFVVERFGENLG